MSESNLVGGSKQRPRADSQTACRLYRRQCPLRPGHARSDLEQGAGGAVLQSQRAHLQGTRPLVPAVGILRTERASRATGRRSISAASCPTTWRWSGAIVAPGATGPARSRRRRISITAATNSSPARPWCSARRPASGASCTRIFPRRARARVPAAYRPGRSSARRAVVRRANVSDLPKLSVRLHGGIDPGRCVALAKAAEAAGFHSVWFAENAFNRGVLPAASACARGHEHGSASASACSIPTTAIPR